MKLDPNWKQSWRWLSMHAMTLALAVQGAWLLGRSKGRAVEQGKTRTGIDVSGPLTK